MFYNKGFAKYLQYTYRTKTTEIMEQRIEENEKRGLRWPQDVPPQVLSQWKVEYNSKGITRLKDDVSIVYAPINVLFHYPPPWRI